MSATIKEVIDLYKLAESDEKLERGLALLQDVTGDAVYALEQMVFALRKYDSNNFRKMHKVPKRRRRR